MRPWRIALVGGTSLAVIGSGLIVGFPMARAQEDSGGEVRAARDDAVDLLHAAALHRRQDLDPFTVAVRNESDLELGRLNFMLQLHIPAEFGSSQAGYIAEAEDVMDLHMVTYRAFRTTGSLLFIHDYDPTNPELITHYKSGIFFPDSSGSTTIHFNPPLRIREGDLIIGSFDNADAGLNGGVVFFMHGTVPDDGVGGDTLRVE